MKEKFSEETKKQIIDCVIKVIREKRKQGDLSKDDLPVSLFKKLVEFHSQIKDS